MSHICRVDSNIEMCAQVHLIGMCLVQSSAHEHLDEGVNTLRPEVVRRRSEVICDAWRKGCGLFRQRVTVTNLPTIFRQLSSLPASLGHPRFQIAENRLAHR